ncbi:MAG: tRNA (cytidine(34)-2'-O)-methyltransferase [Verrucomicrobiales bacterium]|nr:tRNA (cytidine(34)-2'-O)-methyltransferase [Verrucomicrobiales bacterium]MCP5560088.1 tRNA (cytidine(34)-2'-O)-methyltransferase [Verrucomicrobiaceae bacterium]
MINVVLYQPEIPHNTGAIGRLCLGAGARLHLIEPLGFSLDDRHLKRAGLDYWKEVDVCRWSSWEAFLAKLPGDAKLLFLTSKARQAHWHAPLGGDDVWLVFGPETRGLPESLLAASPQQCLTIPMQGTRSLNLATAVAIVLFESVRQRSKGE